MTKVKEINNHSSFWTGDYFDSFNELESNDPKRVYKLSVGKRSIANFVNIATGKRIPVKFNDRGNSYTDGNTVVIGSDITSPADFDVAVGLALHEASHIVHTKFETLSELRNLVGSDRLNRIYSAGLTTSTVKDILNVIEDRRLDSLSYNSAPGYREYYRKMYDKYFNSPIIDKALLSKEYTSEDIESYMFRIINIHNPNTRLDALKGLQKIWDIIDLANIDRLKDTYDALWVALEVTDVILDNIAPIENVNDESKSQQQPGDDSEITDDSSNEEESSDSAGNSKDDQTEDSENTSTDAEGDNTNEGSGNSAMSASFEGGDDTDTDPNADAPELSKSAKNRLERQIRKQTDFLNGDVKKKTINKNENKLVENFDKTQSEFRTASSEFSYNGTPVDVMVMNKVLPDTTSNVISPAWWITKSSYQDEVTEGLIKGRILGKKLKVRSESRSTIYNRQKSGKIDKRMISSLGYGNSNVFLFNEIDEYNDANLHISVDASSSMDGKKWSNTLVNVTAICMAVSMIEGLEVQVTLRSSQSQSNSHIPLVVKVYDSREDKISKIKWLFPRLQPGGTTPEGLCFEAIQKDFISKSSKKDSYFINISDGEPFFTGKNFSGGRVDYSGEPAFAHTKKQMRSLTDRGIKVLSYYVSERTTYTWVRDNFIKMYGKNAKFVDITSVSDIARTVNQMFLEKSKS